MITYRVVLTDEQDAVLRAYAADEGYASAETLLHAKVGEVIGALVVSARARLATKVAAALDDPVRAAAIRKAAGL